MLLGHRRQLLVQPKAPCLRLIALYNLYLAVLWLTRPQPTILKFPMMRSAHHTLISNLRPPAPQRATFVKQQRSKKPNKRGKHNNPDQVVEFSDRTANIRYSTLGRRPDNLPQSLSRIRTVRYLSRIDRHPRQHLLIRDVCHTQHLLHLRNRHSQSYNFRLLLAFSISIARGTRYVSLKHGGACW